MVHKEISLRELGEGLEDYTLTNVDSIYLSHPL